MKRIVAAVLLLLMIGSTMATPPPKDIPKTVVFVFLADQAGNPLIENGAPVANGTGFFAFVENPNGPGGWGYVVTAKHVLLDQNGYFFRRVFLRVNDKSDGAGFIALDLESAGPNRSVFVHPDPTVDIAVIPALPLKRHSTS